MDLLCPFSLVVAASWIASIAIMIIYYEFFVICSRVELDVMSLLDLLASGYY